MLKEILVKISNEKKTEISSFYVHTFSEDFSVSHSGKLLTRAKFGSFKSGKPFALRKSCYLELNCFIIRLTSSIIKDGRYQC